MITFIRSGEPGLRAWLTEHAAGPTLLGLDVETTGLDLYTPTWHMRMLQLGTCDDAIVIEVAGNERPLKHILQHPNLTFVTHSNYDSLAILSHLGVDLSGKVKDTLIMSKLQHPERGYKHGLKDLCANLLNDSTLKEAETGLQHEFACALHQHMASVDEGERKNLKKILRAPKKLAGWGFENIPIDDSAYVGYAGMDAMYVRRLYSKLLDNSLGQETLIDTEHWLSDQVTLLQNRGLRLDEPACKTLLSIQGAAEQAARDRLEAAFGFPALSPFRAKWLIEHGATLNQEYTTPKGELSLCKEQVEELDATYTKGLLGTVTTDMRVLSGLKNTVSNLKNFIKHSTDTRVHPQVKPLQAITGRMSVVNPPMQTLKKQNKELRSLFLADAGMSLVAVDFSQIEIRVAAALSGDTSLTESILSGSDIHSDTAQKIFGENFTEEQRQIAKITNFGSIYGGGATALAKNAGIPEKEAAKVVRMWKKAYPGLVAYGKRLGMQATLVNPFGRILPVDPDKSYASLNYMVQSTARDIFVQQMREVIEKLDLSSNLWMIVHDELIFQVADIVADDYADDIKAVMETEFMGIPLTADATILGESWGGAV